MIRRLLILGAITGVATAATASAAFADHAHVRHVGHGDRCVIVALDGGEDAVVLPGVIFERGITSDTVGGADHPLHVLVHKGRPNAMGGDTAWQLYTSNTCDGYVNQR